MSKCKSIWNQGESLVFTGKNNDMELNSTRLFNHYSLIATNRFKWENLPPGVKSEHIEENLFAHGQVLFFDDDELGLLTLPCSIDGGLNVYGEPIDFNVWGVNYNKRVKGENAIRIKANDTCFPQINQVQYYTDMLADIEKTMKLNLKQQWKPYIIGATKKNELSLKNFFKKVLDKLEDSIFVDERFSESMTEGIKVFNLDSKYLLDDLQVHKEKTVNELLTLLGINNLAVTKKERLVSGEVDVNNQNIDMNLDLEYKNRLIACREINEKFGLDIKVTKTIDEFRVDEGENNIDDNKKKIKFF